MNAGTLEIQLMANIARLQSDMDAAKRTVGNATAEMSRAVDLVKNAFAALGVVAAATSFANMIRSTADALDKLNDLNKSTGLTVETLAGLQVAAKKSGGDLEGIAQAINKLSVNIAKDAEKFRAIGVSAKDPIEAFKQLADVFSKIQDPQLRAAVGAEALGKSWASAAPLLAEGGKQIEVMIERGKRLSGATTAAAEAADKFNDQMTELETVIGRGKMKLAGELLPALTEVTREVTRAYEESGKLKAAWIALGGLSTAIFTNDFASDQKKIKDLRTEIEVMKHHLHQSQSVPVLSYVLFGDPEFWYQSIEQKENEMLGLMKRIRDAGKSEQPAVDPGVGLASPEQLEAWKKFVAGAKSGAAAVKSEYEKLIEKLQKDLTKAIGEAEAALHGYNKAQAEFIALAASDEWKKLTNAQRASVAALFEKKIVQEQVTEAAKRALEMAKEQAAYEQEMLHQRIDFNARQIESAEAAAKSAEDALAAAQAEFDQYGLTKSQIAELTLAQLELNKVKKDGAVASSEYYDAEAVALQRQIDAQKKLVQVLRSGEAREEAAKAADQAKRDWEELDRTAQDVFRSMFEGGDDAFKKLGDSLKRHLIDMLYQMTVRQWILGVSVNGSGQNGVAGMMTGGQGGGNLMQQGGSYLYNQYGGSVQNWVGSTFGVGMEGVTTGAAASSALASSAFTGAAGAELAAGAGLGVGAGVETGALVAAGAEAGVGAGISAGLAAVPVWGWIALAAIALFSAFGDDGPEQSTYFKFGANKEKGDFSVNARGNEGVTDYSYVGNKGIESAFGTFGVSETFWGNDKLIDPLLSALKTTEDKLASLLTKDEITRASDYIKTQDDIMVGSGAEGADTSAAMAIVFSKRISMIFEGVETGLSDLVKGFAGNSEQLAAEAATLLSMRAHLAEYSKVIGEDVTLQSMAALKKEGESSAQAIARLGAEFAITNDVAKMLGKTSEQAFGAVGLASAGAREALIKAAGGLDKFTAQTQAYYANFFTEEQQRANTVTQANATMAETFEKLGVAVPQTHEEFNKLLASYLDGTEAGAAAYQSVMNVSGSFVAVHGTAQQAAEATKAAAAAFKQTSESIFASIARLTGAAPTNTALTQLGGINSDWGSIGNLLTITPTDLAAINKGTYGDLKGSDVVSLISQALSFAASNMSQSSGGPLNVYQGVIGDGTSTATAETQSLPNHALQIELLRLQGKALEALNLQRQDELQALSESDKALKQQIYELQDAAMLRKMNSDLLAAEGRTYEAMLMTRAETLRTLTEEQYALQSRIYAAQDRAKTEALQVQIATLLGDSTAALAASRAKELAALSPTDRALQEQIYRLQDQAKAAKEATAAMSALTKQMDAVANLKSSIQQSISSIRPDTAGALAAAQASMAKAMGGSIDDRIKAAGTLQSAIMAQYQEQMNAAQTLHQEQSAAAQQAIAAQNQLNAAYRKLGDYAQSLLVGNLSALSPEEKLAAARGQYMSALAGARGGDAKAAESLQGFAQTYLEQARGYFASNEDYVGIFSTVQSALAQLGSMAGPDQVFQQNSIALQTELTSIQNSALEQLTSLSNLTDDWQAELQAQLEEQAIAFTELGLNTAQIAANTDGLDIRIGQAVALAVASKIEAYTATMVECLEAQTQAQAAIAETQAGANDEAVERQTVALAGAIGATAVIDRR